MRNGFDVSQHQGDIDFTKAASQVLPDGGMAFVYAKATEGEDFVDPRFKPSRVRLIRGAGLKLGVYHFLRPRPGRTGDVEARFAVQHARLRGWGKPGDLVLGLDVEVTDFHGARATRRYVRQFVKEYHRLTGHYPAFYTFPSFAQTVGFGRWLAKRCPLWIAHFGVAMPTVPKAWAKRGFAIHQHTSTGRVAGIKGNVDMNRARSLPLIPAETPAPVKPDRKPLTRRQKLVRSLHRRRARFLDVRTDAALRKLLFAKARLGIWDKRYCLHFGPNPDVNDRVKAYVTRGFAAGLVPTSLRRAPRRAGDHSHHIDGNAGDVALRRDEVGTVAGQRKMEAFQHSELLRAQRTPVVELELIGPDNEDIILRGVETDLVEGTALETQHDTHVHCAP